MRRLILRIGPSRRGKRLDEVLGAWLPQVLERPLSKSALRQLVMAGAVRLDGEVVRRPTLALRAGSLLEAHVQLERLPAGEPREAAALSAASVLYEDPSLIAFDKPAGLAMHAQADKSRADFYSLARRFLAKRAGRDDVYLGLHQRLDRETSGVVLFTLDPAANKPLADAFAARTVVKTYEALVERGPGRPPERWQVRNRLALVGHGRNKRVRSVEAGGQPAETDFRLVEVLTSGWRIEAVPRTGRQHQIRAHLAEAGWPILGDVRYGASVRPVGRTLLHARRLELEHPLTNATLRIESALPADFEETLTALRR